jgi:Fe-S-cluster-containing hydrogenase component 2
MRDIKVVENRCVGCLTCALWCSYVKQKEINPYKAYIIIERRGDNHFKITFTEECDNCSVCVNSCYYGAIEMGEEER